jgi:4-amino-4-deoxychorismate lyase
MLVALLDGTLHDPNQPLLHPDDLGVLRGDGIFETLLAIDGRPRELDAHLARLTRSAEMLELPEPDHHAWRRATRAVLDAAGSGEWVLRFILTRGVERLAAAGPTSYVTCSPVPEWIHRARRDGIRVTSMTRGTDAELAPKAPWLLLGAKTLSYAMNMAALREAARRGADDAIFVSEDGEVLEAPTATVVAAGPGPQRLRTPPATGILAGTTQRALFRAADAAGWRTAVEQLTLADLHAADAVWLLSSVRLAAPVVALDGLPLSRAVATETVLDLLAAGDRMRSWPWQG